MSRCLWADGRELRAPAAPICERRQRPGNLPRWGRLVQLFAGLDPLRRERLDAAARRARAGPLGRPAPGALAPDLGLGVGTWAIIVGGAGVLLLWIPLRQCPGVGTVCNVIVVGAVIDLMLAVVPAPHGLVLRWVVLVGGIFLNGVATGAYIGAGLGPGPRTG